VEESLRGHTGVSAQTRAPLDRQEIEPVIVEEFMTVNIGVHGSFPFGDKQKASP
jgi:hypothetical protein